MITPTDGRHRARTATGVLAALSVLGVGGASAVAHASITPRDTGTTAATDTTVTSGATDATGDDAGPQQAPQQLLPQQPAPQVDPGSGGSPDARSNGS